MGAEFGFEERRRGENAGKEVEAIQTHCGQTAYASNDKAQNNEGFVGAG